MDRKAGIVMRIVIALSAALFLSVALTGCNDEITASDVRRDMASDLQTPALSKEENYNRIHHTFTMNLRKMQDDLTRLMLFDHASRSLHHPTTQE